jgi:hypothetical protein
MGLNYSKSHIFTVGVRNACYDTNATDFLNLYDPLTAGAFRRTFRETNTFQFMVDGSNKSEILYYNGMLVDTRIPFGGGAEVLYTDPTKVNWCIVNRQGYLWIYLHEIDGVHSLVYRTTNRILNTLRRKHMVLQFNLSTSVLTLLVDSLPEALVIDTSSGTFRATAGSFTALQDVANAGFLVGGGSAYFPSQKGDFTLYYDSYIDRILTSLEVNAKYQVLQDTRALPPPGVGKILISSDRGANGYDIYRVNGDFTDPILEVGEAVSALYYPRWSRNPVVDDLTYVSAEGSSQFPKVKLGNNLHYAYDFHSTIQGLGLSIGYYNGALSPTLDVDNKIHGIGLGLTGGSTDTDFWEIDPANSDNSFFYYYNIVPPTAISHNAGTLLRFAGSSDSHPINRNKIVVELQSDSFGARIVIWDRATNTIDDVLYTDSFVGGNRNTMYQPKFNYNGTRVGFTTYLSYTYPGPYMNKTAFVVNYDGSGLVNVGTDVDFLSFCSHGAAADKTYAFSRPLVSPEIVTITLNGVVLSAVPFNTNMATTLDDIKTQLLTQAAVDTVTIVGNTFRVLAKIDKSLDLSIAISGNATVITATTTTNTVGVDTEVLLQKYELSIVYAQYYYRIYKKNLRTLAEVNMSGDVPYNDYWADWKA